MCFAVSVPPYCRSLALVEWFGGLANPARRGRYLLTGAGGDAGSRWARGRGMIWRSATVATRATALTATMIRAITCRPWSVTRVRKTMAMRADEAIEPM